MIQITFPVGPLACNCSIVADEGSRQAVVIDPGDQVAGIVQRLEQHRLSLTAILVTHAHIDHIGGAAELKRLTGAPVWLNQRDIELQSMMDEQAAWLGVKPPAKVTIDGDLNSKHKIRFGDREFAVLETPGHTEGSVCLYLPQESTLFAGDTLFAGSIGRTDLPGGDFDKIMASIHGTLLALPDSTRVIPGHGPATTIENERRMNPFLIR